MSSCCPGRATARRSAWTGIAFEGKTTNLGAIGTTWTVVTGYDLSLAALAFTLTPGNNRLDIPTGGAGSYELRYEMSLYNSLGVRTVQCRLTKGGVAITGTQRTGATSVVGEPGFLAGSVLLDSLVAADQIKVEARMTGATTTGDLLCADGLLTAQLIRLPA
jgi:hypothetical protein